MTNDLSQNQGGFKHYGIMFCGKVFLKSETNSPSENVHQKYAYPYLDFKHGKWDLSFFSNINSPLS